MFKILSAEKAKMAGLLLGILCAATAAAANAITFTYSEKYSSCDTLTVSPAGVITCNCASPFTSSGGAFFCNTGGATAFRFNFSRPLSCAAGLDINAATGSVDCATTLPSCTLGAVPPGTAAPGDVVALTATCSNTPTGYQWTSAPELVPASSTAQLTIPATTPAGYYSYSVMASNAAGAGNSASAILKVAIPGEYGPLAYIPGNGNSGKVSVIDTATNTASSNLLGVGAIPVGVAVHPSGIKAYVTNQGHNTVSVIDAATNAVIATVDVAPVGQSPAGVAVTPDGSKAYVANYTTDNVSVIDAGSDTVLRTVPLPAGSKPTGVATTKKPDGTRQVFVANSGANTVSVIDPATDTVAYTAYTDAGPHGVAAKPDGTKIYVANSTSNSITVIDTSTYQSAGYSLGASAVKPQGIAVKPDGTEVYVVNNGSGTVSVFNTADNTISATISGLGALPYSVAFNPAGSLAYVTNSGSSNVSIIDTATRSVVDTISVGATPYALGQFVGPASPYRGLWWNPSEDGWGMSITQHGSMIFVAAYTYDQTGQPTWYVMSSCPVGGTSCTGDLYEVTGGTLPTVAWNGSGLKVNKVGTGTLTFTNADSGDFTFTINGTAGSKTISRQVFRADTTTPAVNYTDLWWNAGESGWGVALTQQFGTIFATWYSYDAAGNATWYVASDCAVAGSGCTGDLYHVAGGSSLTSVWNSASKVVTKVGTITFAFSDAGNGTMSYNINGETGSKIITRQPF
ncbi:MAG: YncE family protein [Gallionella sp.]|nr:YncE family protein [Gallionella sp.]